MTLASEALAQSTFFNSGADRLKKKLEEQKRQRALVLQGIHEAVREKHSRIVATPKWAPDVSSASEVSSASAASRIVATPKEAPEVSSASEASRIVATPKWAPEVSEAAGTKRTAVKSGALQAVGKPRAKVAQAEPAAKVAPPQKKKPRLEIGKARGTVADCTGLGQNCL